MLNMTILSILMITIGILSVGDSLHQISNPSNFKAKWIKVK